ncbi:hypothetical protein CVIRNUC_000257 [Coccomyxa viridis]|uniref:Extracellular protein n=1 Tax=Coccomyxa viridis TaxID=1274662 RepID=A0AAV1HPP6_9CHLO|nr:hypothetical protein CVIRNUC_000257 [Coccomyxa viridis]
MTSRTKSYGFALACYSMLVLVCSESHPAGTRTILQAGANMLNNNAPSLAPAPGMAPTVNVTTRSFFVLTAATGSLTRTKSNDPTFTNGAVLTLDYIDQQVTWYSEAPLRQSGAMGASTFANASFFQDPSLPSDSWLNAGNMAVSYTDANTSLHGTTVLAIASAPTVLNGGSSWRINVTINSDSDSFTRVVTALNSKAQTVHEPALRRMTSVSVFFSGACYNYNRNTGEIAKWYFCTYISRNGNAQYS